MREVLFRAKNRNADWIYGSVLFHDGNNATMFYQHPYDGHLVQEEVDPETVGEFTGFLDKKGNKVFEGDIVKVMDEYIDYAIWANGCFCMARQIMFYEFTYQDSNRMEVIGNIHDNPELLKIS